MDDDFVLCSIDIFMQTYLLFALGDNDIYMHRLS